MINIAIDGPSGAGKSSLAKSLAKELSYIHVDTGALYRTIGLYAVRKGTNTKDSAEVTALLGDIRVSFGYDGEGGQHVYLNGEDVSDKIRDGKVAMAASDVSAIADVRAFLLDLQREIASRENIIMDGRDVGTVVLPRADIKLFLTASPEARAKRRYEEYRAKGLDVTYEKVYSDISERDRNDSTRAIAPLRKADDAVIIDNSGYKAEDTFAEAIRIIRGKLNDLRSR